MDILLREASRTINDEEKTIVVALNTDDGMAMTRIENPSVWCDNDNLNTEFEHADGIYWESWEKAKEQLKNHLIITD